MKISINTAKKKIHKGLALGAAVLTLMSYSSAHAEFDLGIETEAAFVDSEGAIAAEEDARRTNTEEKRRLAQEKQIREREEKKARELEAKAKGQIAKWSDQTKIYRAERVQLEKKSAEAKAKQLAIERDLAAKSQELQALHEIVEQAIAERDQTELMVEQAQDKIANVEKKMAEEKKRRADAQAGLAKAKLSLEASRARLKELRRPASASAAAASGKGKMPTTVSTTAVKKAAPAKTND